jgi:hypothetical protein
LAVLEQAKIRPILSSLGETARRDIFLGTIAEGPIPNLRRRMQIVIPQKEQCGRVN